MRDWEIQKAWVVDLSRYGVRPATQGWTLFILLKYNNDPVPSQVFSPMSTRDRQEMLERTLIARGDFGVVWRRRWLPSVCDGGA